MNSSNSQEQSAVYTTEQIPDFLEIWSNRLNETQSKTVSILEEFSAFWESAQLYFSPKHSSKMHNQKLMIELGLEMGFLPKYIPRITETLIYFIGQDRNGITIPTPQIKKSAQIMHEIGIIEENIADVSSRSSPNKIHVLEYFRNAVIKDLMGIYNKRSKEWLQMATPEYCRVGLTYYQQELKRAEELYPLIFEEARDALVDIIITQKYEFLCTNTSSGILQQLSRKAITDLAAVYSLFKQSIINKQELYPPIKKMTFLLGDYISEQIKLIFNKQREGDKNLIEIAQEILEMSSYVGHVVKEAFENDRNILKESEYYIEQALNAQNRRRVILTFANYTHFIAKNSVQNNIDNDFNTKTNSLFKVINKLEDKEAFMTKFKELLAIRLLDKPNIDFEKKFLDKMGSEWSLYDQYSIKNMLDDISSSDEVLMDWKSQRDIPNNLEFSIKVLQALSWPKSLFVTEKRLKIFYDPILQDYMKKFTMYYQNKYKDRTLEWVVNYGNVEIEILGFQSTYFLRTTPIQMAVLLVFNEANSITYGNMKVKLGFSEDSSALWEALRFFTSNLKLIKREKAVNQKEDEKEPEEDEKFTVNMGFKSGLMKIDCLRNPVQKPAIVAHVSAADKKFVLDAAIVRIMKSRREIALLDLEREAIQMTSLFT